MQPLKAWITPGVVSDLLQRDQSRVKLRYPWLTLSHSHTVAHSLFLSLSHFLEDLSLYGGADHPQSTLRTRWRRLLEEDERSCNSLALQYLLIQENRQSVQTVWLSRMERSKAAVRFCQNEFNESWDRPVLKSKESSSFGRLSPLFLSKLTEYSFNYSAGYRRVM